MVLMLATSSPEILTVPIIEKDTKAELVEALVPICTCESGQGTGKPQHYNVKTGKVLRGEENPKDIGMCQINEYWNGKEAKSYGWDIYTEEGNIQMANFLYKTQGATPWNASKLSCWGKSSKS